VSAASRGTGRRLVVEADGGSRGNPGVAGYGALVRDAETGAVLVELAKPLGRQSNNVAEYSGLVAGLQAAAEIDPGAQVQVRMDSKLVVEQMSGRWKVKHEDMRRLAAEASELRAGFVQAGGSVDFQWVPRAENKAADALSNDAMDGKTVHRVHTSADSASADRATTTAPGRTPGAVPGAEDATTAPGRTPGTVPGAEDATTAPGRTPAVVSAEKATTTAPGRGSGGARREGLVPARPLRLLLVQVPHHAGVADRIAKAAARLVDQSARVITVADDDARHVASELATALGAEVEPSDEWAGTARGEGADERVLAAYDSIVSTGGTVVVVTTRRAILSVLADVLQTPVERFWAMASAPGSLTAVEVWEDGSASVAFTNRTDHLA
jgi:probable phosphoglycerate mutase